MARTVTKALARDRPAVPMVPADDEANFTKTEKKGQRRTDDIDPGYLGNSEARLEHVRKAVVYQWHAPVPGSI